MHYRQSVFDIAANVNGTDHKSINTLRADWLIAIQYHLLVEDDLQQAIHISGANGFSHTIVGELAAAKDFFYFDRPISLGGRSRLKLTTQSGRQVRAIGRLVVACDPAESYGGFGG